TRPGHDSEAACLPPAPPVSARIRPGPAATPGPPSTHTEDSRHDRPRHRHPSYLLMEYILAVLAPLLIAGSISDLRLARLAAMEAIAAYKARGEEELMTIAQIAGFAIAALDNLRLSAAPELSVSLKLKLRGNAAALS